MDLYSQFEDLKTIANKLSIEIKWVHLEDEEFRFQSGLCRYKKKYLIILDDRLLKDEQITILIESLEKFDLDGLYMTPWIRSRLEERASKLTCL